MVAGLAAAAFDGLLEPVAVRLGYWVWSRPLVPLQNYAAWAVIAGGCSWWASRFPRLPSHPVVGWYVALQAVFFVGLGWGLSR